MQTNFKYLKNVILKYMTCKRSEGRHLVTVIATILHFTDAEVAAVHRSVEETQATWLNIWG